jgi:hypothetical protein
MKYGTFRYGTAKYGAFKTITAKIVTSSVFTHGRLYFKTIMSNIAFAPVIKKSIRKIVSVLIKFTTIFKRYKQVFPVLTYEEYHVDLETTTYDIELKMTTYEILLEVIGLAISGSTVKLQATFPDSAGNLMELENVVCKIYSKGKVLVDTIEANVISPGVYSVYYTIPDDNIGLFDFEFSGTLGNKTVKGRSSFPSVWK